MVFGSTSSTFRLLLFLLFFFSIDFTLKANSTFLYNIRTLIYNKTYTINTCFDWFNRSKPLIHGFISMYFSTFLDLVVINLVRGKTPGWCPKDIGIYQYLRSGQNKNRAAR